MSAYAARRARAGQALEDLDLEALAISNPFNLRYLTGFAGEGLLLLSEAPVLITDRRYEIEAHEQAGDCRVLAADKGHLTSLLEALRAQAPARLGFEGDSLTYAQYATLQDGLPGAELVSTSRLVETLRLRKEPAEIELIARAAAIGDHVLDRLLPQLEPGASEKEIAQELSRTIMDAGAEAVSFPPIVAGGPRSALPHATPTDRALQPGDVVLFDLGARVEGYCSDITRTLTLGAPPDEFCARYRAVHEAQRAGIAAAKPGVSVAEVDQAARQVLGEAGFGEQFSHSLGHGVGLEVHELPAVSARSAYVLEPGNVFTIEPGIYFEGWGGLRLEDLFAMEESGPRQLTWAPKFAC